MNLQRQLFKRQFDAAAFREFRTTYEGINPDRPVETDGIAFDQTYGPFQSWVQEDPESQAFVDEFLPQLGMFLQGPFPLPGKRTTRSAWDCRTKVGAYAASGIVPEFIAGKRCLDVGCNAGYDPFLLSSMGALEVVGAEPHGFYFHSLFLSAVYARPGVSFVNLGWENLDPAYLRDFDVISCLGLIYHVKEPFRLIEKLAGVMRSGATLVMETHVLSEPSKQALFIEGPFWGDETYWWVLGDECMQSMLRSSGFKNVRMTLKMDCDSRSSADRLTTVEGHPAGARAWFVAEKI